MRTSVLSRVLLPVMLAAVVCSAQEAIQLPKPQTEGGKPLMQALNAVSYTHLTLPTKRIV